MRLQIRGVFIKCRKCQGEDFYPAFPLTAARRDVMICAACENELIYSELAGTGGKKTRAVPDDDAD